MLEPQPKDLQEMLAGRLAGCIGDGDEDIQVETERGEAAILKDVVADELQPSVETVDEIHPDAIGTNELELQAPTFAKVEKSLISLGFFTPSSRRIKNQKIKTITFTRTVDGKKVVATAEFHPSATLGLPITADQDRFLALHHIITKLLRETGTISNPIRFTSAEMLRLLNKDRDSGKNYKDISEWLDVMMSTTIISNGVVYEAGKQRFARDRFHVFARAVSVGKEMPDGTIADANYVWLSEWQLENINAKFLLPIDLLAYRELKNHIAKALVPLLQVWLFASQRAGSFEKRYDELCEMLSLKSYKAASRITQQLKGSLDELTHHEYLEKWRIERVADKKSFKIVFFHGPKFHRDRRRRLAEKALAEETTVVSQWQPTDVSLPEPGRLEVETPLMNQMEKQGAGLSPVAAGLKMTADVVGDAPSEGLTIENSTPLEDRIQNLADEFSARGVMPTTGAELLQSLAAHKLDIVCDYIDYWDETRRTKEVGPGFLYRLVKDWNPLPSNFVTRRQRADRQAARKRNYDIRQLEAVIARDYEEHCSKVLDRYLAEELPAGEFDRRVSERKVELLQQGGFWADGPRRDENAEKMATHEIRAQLSEDVLPSFEDFYKRQLPVAIEKLGLDPVALGVQTSN